MPRPGAHKAGDGRSVGDSPPADALPPLAEAKMAAPRQRAGMVTRPRIRRALEAGGTQR